MQSKLSIYGLYQWDPTILTGAQWFPFAPELPVEDFFLLLTTELCELPLVWPNGDIMRKMVKAWCKTMQYRWKGLYNSTKLEYNAIENYNRTETVTTKSKTTGSTQNNGSDSTTQQRTAYDNLSLADTAKETVTMGSGNSVTGDVETSHTNKTSGNIGVTTTQQMLEQERTVLQFNFFETVVEDFKKKFCIEVY